MPKPGDRFRQRDFNYFCAIRPVAKEDPGTHKRIVVWVNIVEPQAKTCQCAPDIYRTRKVESGEIFTVVENYDGLEMSTIPPEDPYPCRLEDGTFILVGQHNMLALCDKLTPTGRISRAKLPACECWLCKIHKKAVDTQESWRKGGR